MNDCHVAIPNLRCVVSLQPTNRLFNVRNLQGISCLQLISHCSFASKERLVSGTENISCDGIGSSARLGAEKLQGLRSHLVKCSEVQHVGSCYISAVLLNFCFQFGYVQALSIRSYTLGERFLIHLRKTRELSELNLLSVSARNWSLLTELIVNQFRFCRTNQNLVIEGFHFRGKVVRCACRSGNVGVQIEQVKNVLKHILLLLLYSCISRYRQESFRTRMFYHSLLPSESCPYHHS